MADIKITELSPPGSDLFQDAESFLGDLRDDEIGDIKGGYSPAQYKNFLKILHCLTIASNIRLTNRNIYNTIGRTIGNTVGRFNTISNSVNSNPTTGINSLRI